MFLTFLVVRPAGFGKRFTTAATPDSLGRFHRIYQLRGNTGFNKKSTGRTKIIIVINTLQMLPLNVCTDPSLKDKEYLKMRHQTYSQ